MLAGFGFSVVEPMSLVMLIVVGRLLNAPQVVNLYRLTPSYNLDNVRAWYATGIALTEVAEEFTAAPGLLQSLLILGLWMTGLIALSVFVFQRQDVT